MSLWERLRDNPWRLMIAVNVVVAAGGLIHKVLLPPYVPYIHLLVDYHFGFTKRALIGAIVSLFATKIPVWLVFAIGGAALLVTAGLFVALFLRTFRLESARLPLFVFMAGSPFFFKNFIYTLGHFDIYGCMLTIIMLLIPARSLLFVLIAAIFSAILILIHHIHFLMYVPTIAMIVVLRYYLVQNVRWQNVVAGITGCVGVGALFIATQFAGSMTVPEADFVKYLSSRMADPSQTQLLSFSYIWYQNLSREIQDTWARLPHNSLGIPVFGLLIWLHAPLLKYFGGLIRALASDFQRRVVMLLLVAVSAGYLVMFAIVFDYSRWISNWAVCMFLILHAVKMLPAAAAPQLNLLHDRKASIFGWIITLIPRVGIVRPF